MPQIILVKGDEKGRCMNCPSYSTVHTYILYMEVVRFINSNPHGCGLTPYTVFKDLQLKKKKNWKKLVKINFSTENIYRSNVLVLYPSKNDSFCLFCASEQASFFTPNWGGVRGGVDCYSAKQKQIPLQRRGIFIHRLWASQISGYFLPEL